PTRRSTTPWQPPNEDLAAIFFTSGTTGQPKGCMISHSNLCSQLDVFDDRIPIDSTCRLASILPLSHLFELTCGLLYPMSRGAALPTETQRLWERLGVDVVQGYGTSECSPVVACGEPRITPAGSVGPPLQGVDVRLSNESELLVHGPNVMRGYWHDPQRTAE